MNLLTSNPPTMTRNRRQRRQNRRQFGGGAVGIIVGILALAVVGGTAWYFVSDPFQAKVDEATRQATKWTPENIAKDPDGYAQWALGQMDTHENTLKARQIELSQISSRLERQIADAEESISTDSARMDAIRSSYKDAAADGTFPISVGTATIEQDDAERLMVDARRRIDSNQRIASRIQPTLNRVQDDLEKTADALGNVDTKRDEIRQQLAELRLQETFEDYDQIDETMAAIADTVTSLGTDRTYEVSLDDIRLDEAEDDNRQLTSADKDLLAEILNEN